MLKRLISRFILLLSLILISSCCEDKNCNDITAPQEIDPNASMPTQLSVFNPEIDVLEFEWVDNCDWEKEIRIDRRTNDDDKGYSDWINLARLPKNSENYTNRNVPYDTDMQYRIYAYYDDTMHSEYATIDYRIYLSLPDSLQLTKKDNSSLEITWTNKQGWVDGYKIHRKANEDDWVEYAVLSNDVEEFVDSNLNLEGYFLYKMFSYVGEEISYQRVIGYNNTEMIHVEGGTFTMGDTWNTGDPEINPPHEVTLSSFFISKYEVTRLDWQVSRGYYYGDYSPNKAQSSIFWKEAIEFCNLKSEIENLTPYYTINDINDHDVSVNPNSNGYRLPTEAEWEFAARGGIYSNNYIYSGSNDYSEVAISGYSQVIGTKLPNELGIYDMTGNLSEVCFDIYGEYTSESQINPQGPDSGNYCVVRGESYYSVADRNQSSFGQSSSSKGFRIVRNIAGD